MLLYKDHRFYGYGVSFSIPDGFKVECNPEVLQDGVLMESPDGAFRVEFQIFVNECADTIELLQALKAARSEEDAAIDSLSLNGLYGHSLTRVMEGGGCYDACLLLRDAPEAYTVILVSVWSECNRKIEEIMSLPAVRAILGDLRKESYAEY